MRISSSILIKNHVAAQSYGFSKHRGLGSLANIISGMSDKNIDEINIINIDRNKSKLSCEKTIKEIEALNIDTPIIYGGGFEAALKQLISAKNIERFLISSALIDGNFAPIKEIAAARGKQSVLGCLPVLDIDENGLKVFSSEKESEKYLTFSEIESFSDFIDELLITDVREYGLKGGFHWQFVERCGFPIQRCLISGGIIAKDIKMAEKVGLAGVVLDNFLLHKVEVREDYGSL